MKIEDVEIGASEAAAAIGLSPYCSPVRETRTAPPIGSSEVRNTTSSAWPGESWRASTRVRVIVRSVALSRTAPQTLQNAACGGFLWAQRLQYT